MRFPAAIALLLLLAVALPSVPASGGTVVSTSVSIGSEVATGLVGLPAGPAKGVVAILHGYGHFAESHSGHLQHLADDGWIAVAMDYRGGAGMHLGAGAEDTCAAVAALHPLAPGKPAILYSVSMGGAVAGLVLTSCPEFTYWVSNEGMTSITETWAEATLLAPANAFAAQAKADIEAECGGTPIEAPDCYAARHAVLRVPEFTGLQGVVLTHGVNDGLVPYDQGRELVTALRAEGIPSEFYTVLGCEAGNEGTTITGYATLGGLGIAGHGTESVDAHCLTGLSFGLLDDVLAGSLVPADAEHVVHDGQEVLS